MIAVAELGASSVDLHVRPWVVTADYFATMCDLKGSGQDRLRRERHLDPLPADGRASLQSEATSAA